MSPPPNFDLSSPTFKIVIAAADTYAATHDLDKWGARVLWVALSISPRAARRYASKHNLSSPAWARFTRLVEVGLLLIDPEGIAWDEGAEPWQSDPLHWFDTIVRVAAGAEPPPNLPRMVTA